jgi:enoyl-CoA hydratase/carnithine racemase
VGYSQVSAFKIATENTVLSLPEVGIGHFCDGSNTFTCSRLDGNIGAYLALTGHKIRAEEVL